MLKKIKNQSKTDVHFNHDHEVPEVAELEKWNDLAQKFFRMHQEDLRPVFYRKWAGSNGRFRREIIKLERNYSRKCSSKNLIPRRSSFSKDDFNFDSEEESSFDEVRERRSSGQLRVAHNPGHRMRHIIRNIEKWTEQYLTGCANQQKVIHRWKRFVTKWEDEISKNPIFIEEFEKEERYLRNNDGPGKPCGRIFTEFGLHGQYMELRDASVDNGPDSTWFADSDYVKNGVDVLHWTEFGDNELMSMVPFEGESVY